MSEYQFGTCAHCGQRVGRKDGHWQLTAGVRRLYCKASPTTWHEVEGTQ